MGMAFYNKKSLKILQKIKEPKLCVARWWRCTVMKYCDHFGFFAPGAFNLESCLSVLPHWKHQLIVTIYAQILAVINCLLAQWKCWLHAVVLNKKSIPIDQSERFLELQSLRRYPDKNHLKCNKSWPLISIFFLISYSAWGGSQCRHLIWPKIVPKIEPRRSDASMLWSEPGLLISNTNALTITHACMFACALFTALVWA